MSATVYRPEVLFADGTLTRGGALCVTGEGKVQTRIPTGARVVELPGTLLMPGLINCHSHAFQRVIRGRTEHIARGHDADDFWSWRQSMYAAASSLSPEELYVVSRQAFLEMARAGITTVGEFHYLHHQPDGTAYDEPSLLAQQVIRAARDVGLRIVLLRVAYARAGFQVASNPLQRRFIDTSVDAYLKRVDALRMAIGEDDLVTVGLAPHSVRAVPGEWLTQIAKASPKEVTHFHVAEQPAEVTACLAETGLRPVELLEACGALHANATLVHAVHLTSGEIATLGQRAVSVCACPSTERNLGDGIVEADALARAGVSLCLGTDSQAQIDLLDEARQLEGHLRLLRLRRNVLDAKTGAVDNLGRQLLSFATTAGARSLGLSAITGTLAHNTDADFITVNLRHPSLLGVPDEALLSAVAFCATPEAIQDVAVQGRFIVTRRAHALELESAQAFTRVMERLSTIG